MKKSSVNKIIAIARLKLSVQNHYSPKEEYLIGITNKELYGDLVDITEENGNGVEKEKVIEKFDSFFKPEEMRCLALVAHNHMKPAMKVFVEQREELLKKFRLTGTNTTMTMLKNLFGDDKDVVYGPAFNSGPLGGDAEVCALMCQENLGGVIFFMDPLDAHPHQADIDALIRLSNVKNVLVVTNPTSAHAACYVMKQALIEGRKDLIPSFFHSLESPGVKVYKENQAKEVAALKN